MGSDCFGMFRFAGCDLDVFFFSFYLVSLLFLFVVVLVCLLIDCRIHFVSFYFVSLFLLFTDY